jgi:hypothetical protein
MHLQFDYHFCAQPPLTAAVREPQRYVEPENLKRK